MIYLQPDLREMRISIWEGHIYAMKFFFRMHLPLHLEVNKSLVIDRQV